MRSVILYKTYHGSTKKYADWLKAEIGADIYEYGELKSIDFEQYDRIFVMSGPYIGFMPLNRMLKKIWKKIQDKEVVAIAVGVATEEEEWSKRSYRMIPEEIRAKIKYFKIRGRMKEESEDLVKKENLESIFKALN